MGHANVMGGQRGQAKWVAGRIATTEAQEGASKPETCLVITFCCISPISTFPLDSLSLSTHFSLPIVTHRYPVSLVIRDEGDRGDYGDLLKSSS